MHSALSTTRNAGHKAHFRGGASREGDLIGISCHDGAKATFEKSSSTGKKMAMAAEYYTDGLSSSLLY